MAAGRKDHRHVFAIRTVFWYYRLMRNKFTAVVILALLAGCSGNRKSGSSDIALDNPRSGAGIENPPDFALPGVPLKSEVLPDLQPAADAGKTPAASVAPDAAVKPEEAKPEEAKPAEAKPAAAAEPSGDLKFHLDAAAKYAAKKQYRSAAAEYGAAVEFLPAGDVRVVRLLERQGAMLLKTGKDLKAQEFFVSAVAKAKELNASGEDLANAYLGLGYCQEKAKKIPEAIASYGSAIELSNSKTVKARLADTISGLKKAP